MPNPSIFEISSAGMTLERTRVEVAALNLANANVAGRGAAAYRPLQVVGAPGLDFAAQLLRGNASLAALRPEFRIESANVPARIVHEPGHPLADEKGMVHYPGVDPATEMMTLTGASRAYEANVAAMNTARTLTLKALDIGGTQ
jgi:flagellar basal-body rod protein FlgC